MTISENFMGGMIVMGVGCYFVTKMINYMKDDK